MRNMLRHLKLLSLTFCRVDSLSITDSAEESAFKEANNASETPAVQQFMCIPQPSKGTEWPPIAPAAPFVDAATMNGSSSAVNSSERVRDELFSGNAVVMDI